MPRRLRRMLRWWPVGVICLLVGASFLLRTRSKPTPIVPSPETTYVLGPVDAQGLIDYEAALNERLRDGITPEQNAQVLILRSLGPLPEFKGLPLATYSWLGIEPLPEEGAYFQGWSRYANKHLKQPPPERAEEFSEESSWREYRDMRYYQTSLRPWKASDEPDVARWLKLNELPLAHLKELPRYPRFYNPLVSSSEAPHPRLFRVLLPTLQATREIADALLSRSMLAIEEKRYEAAWDDLMTCHHLGHRVSQAGTFIEGLVGRVILNRAMDAQVVLLDHSPSAPQLKKWSSDLQQLPSLEFRTPNYFLTARYSVLDLLQSIAHCERRERRELLKTLKPLLSSGGSDLESLFARSIDYTPILRKVNQHFDRLREIATFERQWRREEFARIRQFFSAAKPESSSFGYHLMGDEEYAEHVGNCVLDLFMPDVEKEFDRFEHTWQAQQNFKVAFALAIYRAEKGRYPATLDELAPSYLILIPSDLFTGKPLIYKPSDKGYLLYSVGPNGEDEGGRTSSDDPPADDVSIRIPVVKPMPSPNK